MTMAVAVEDLTPGGGLSITIDAPTFRPERDARDLGVFVFRLARKEP